MTVSLTDRDALVVLVIGSSNSAGNTNATSKSLTRPAGTVSSRCLIWDRWLDTLQRAEDPGAGAPYGWSPITSSQNLNLTDVSPVFAIAQMYSNVVFGDSYRYAPGVHFGGKPKGVYFVQYSASSSRATQDASQVSPGASWYPKAKNTGAVTAYETFVNLYLNEALTNLEADPDIDRIFLDCIYVIGNESAGYDASTAFAFDRTVKELVPGMSMLHSELARQIDIGSNELVEVTVKPAEMFAEFVSANTSRIGEVRTAYDTYEKAATWPLSIVDGNLFDVYSRSDDQVTNLTVAGGNVVDFDDTSDQLTLTQTTQANFDVKLGAGDVVEFDFTQSAQQSTGTGTVISSTATSVTLGSLNFTAGSLLGGGNLSASAYTSPGTVTVPAATDNELNHYTGQGVLQMGEALFQARRALDAPVVRVFDNENDGWNDVEAIEGSNS